MIAPEGADRASVRTMEGEAKLKRLPIATGAVGALCAGLIVAPAVGQETIYAPKDCTKPKVEPHRITLTCADAGAQLVKLGWNTWNTDKVKGRGVLRLKDCDPNCAAGGTDRYKAKVKLLNPKVSTCGGQTVMMYQRAHLRFPDEKPPKPKNLRSFRLFCNA